MKMPPNKRAGVTLLETMVSLTIFSLVGAMLFQVLHQEIQTSTNLESRYDGLSNLRKAETALVADLQETSRSQIKSGIVSGGGDAVWFLTATNTQAVAQNNTTSGQWVRDPSTGSALWQKNVLYYLTRPSAPSHSAVANGYTCAADPNSPPAEDGYCPHKMLIRKVIHNDSTATVPEDLLASVSSYLTAPNGYDIGFMSSEPNIDSYAAPRLVATGLISFNVTVATTPPYAIQVDLRALRTREAEKTEAVGFKPLASSRFMLEHSFTVYANNP